MPPIPTFFTDHDKPVFNDNDVIDDEQNDDIDDEQDEDGRGVGEPASWRA